MSPKPRRANRVIVIMGLAGGLACSNAQTPGPGAPTSLTVGIESDPMGGAVGAAHVTTTVGGKPATDETFLVANNPGAFPHAVRLTPPVSDPAAQVGAEIDGFFDPNFATDGSNAPPVLTRLATTNFVPGADMLLRIHLDAQCLQALPGGPPGGPACTAPATCIRGTCQSDSVPTSALEPYTANWPNGASDICKPSNAGPPVVQVGTGQTDYVPATDGETVQMEQGPQGGHHIWMAVRMQNLKQTGSVTTLTSGQPDTGLAGPSTSYVFTFNADQGGYCKLFGLRYQLDITGTDYHTFLGHPLDVTVTITDSVGTTGTGVAHFAVAPTILCLSGDSGVNC
jgi:hypothetical protein